MPFVIVVFSCPCMAINLNIQYNGEFLPDILMLTQGLIVVWFDVIITIVVFDGLA